MLWPALALSAEPGAFKAPPVGTKFRYTDFSLQITQVEGREVHFHVTNAAGAEDVVTQYGWLLTTDTFEPEVRGKRQHDRTAIDALRPLEVGNKTQTRTALGPDRFELSFDVIDVQDVTTLIGTFEAFVISAVERNLSRPVMVERLLWYAPVLGGLVRGQQTISQNGEVVAERRYELLSVVENCLNSALPIGPGHRMAALVTNDQRGRAP
jgi:hypothetical protein